MATDLQSRRSTSKSEALVRRKFAELCARIKRDDLLGHLLGLVTLVAGYACLVGTCDFVLGNTTSTSAWSVRVGAWLGFLILFAVAAWRALRCTLDRVNPYYVAQQLEDTIPDVNNGLINWLDLHDEPLSSAFRTNLSASASEQMENADTDLPLARRRNWTWLGIVSVPCAGLAVLLVLLGPAAFSATMLRAFFPFYTPPATLRTHVQLVHPAEGNVEVHPSQAIRFAARIDGRVPALHRPDAPTLRIRYSADEDFLSIPLHLDDAGHWTAQLSASQVRSGFVYQLTAGDDQTQEYEVRVRPRAHVAKFEVAYRYQSYRPQSQAMAVFPNQTATRPVISGPRGAEVRLTLHPSRSTKAVAVELATKSGPKKLPASIQAEGAFGCAWTLKESGKFRVTYTADDGENNVDRDWYDIVVTDDLPPRVVLTQPGPQVELPYNGILELEGLATSHVGIRELRLQMRIEKETSTQLAARPYRPEKSLQHADGKYPVAVEYVDHVLLDEIKTAGGESYVAKPGTVIEYWLEAVDCTDYTNPPGNVGKSIVQKVVLAKSPLDAVTRTALQNAAAKKLLQHHKKQDSQPSKSSDTGNTPSRSTPDKNELQSQLDKIKKENQGTQQKLDQAAKDDKGNNKGDAKSSEPQNGEAKPGPDKSAAENGPQQKPQDNPPNDPGGSKDEGSGKGSSGNSKDGGEKQKSPQNGENAGDRKDGPKGDPSSAKDDGQKGKAGPPSGGAKDAGPMGMDTPVDPQAKSNPGGSENAPRPTNKQGSDDAPIAKNPPPNGHSKGVESNGPDAAPKGKETAKDETPPNASAKSNKMNDGESSGDSKQGPSEADGIPNQARGEGAEKGKTGPSWDEMLDLLDKAGNTDPTGKAAAEKLSEIAKTADDTRKRDIAKEILNKLAQDSKGAKAEKKGPNPFGSGTKSAGISDELKSTAAKREFTARIGQLQLDDWQKRVTPNFLKKAKMTQEEWNRYVDNMKRYDALARQLNAVNLRDALKTELRGGKTSGGTARDIDGSGTPTDPFGASQAATPPELRDALRRFTAPPANP